jgi:serine/threonine protein kinase/tetratricopeptide (TPR) repeat protein
MSETPTPVLYGKYQLLEQLARGGMAEVYKAKAHGVEGFEKILVIKRILPELSQNPRFLEMFINEAKIAVTLSHANIVQVFDLGQAQDSYFIAMEFVAGMDLASMLKQAQKAQRRVSPELAVYIISELAKGLDYAHRRRDSEHRPLNIVHRDVSPQNVLLSYEGEVKLTDFGIAKARTLAQSVTDVGVVKGKYAYMAPEQIIGKPLDARADIFSAGVLLYETLAGVNPFQASSNYDTLQRIRAGDVTPIENLVGDVPDDVVRVLRTAMATDTDKRYATAGQLYEDLVQYLYGTGRRFGARDLAEFLSQLRTGGNTDDGRSADGLKESFAIESITAFEDKMPERTRVGRGRKPSRETVVRRGRDTSATPHRERTEWRDVTAVAVRLAADDELKLKAITHLAERFGGSLAEDPAADSGSGQTLILMFGDKNPDGRDSENGALCALRISRAASAAAAEAGRSTSVAIALHAGRVLVDLSGGLLRDDHHAGLLASLRRLAEQSGSSQVLVNADAEKALRNRFRLVPAGQQSDGAFLLASERTMAEAYGRFIGRRDELKVIGEALARANRGELRVVGLTGEAGSGKSRLMVETMRRLGLAGHNVGLHVATLTPQMQAVPLSAIQEMLRAVLGVDEFDPDALLRDRTTRLRELGLVSAEQAAVAAALGLKTTGRVYASHRPLRAALLRIIRKLAEDRLTIFAWDGAEHMDTDSQTIVDDMLRAVAQARVAVFLSYRPPHRPRWSDLPSFLEIKLGPMTDDDIARLTATRLGADEIPFELLREVMSKSGGNPLYVEEYLKALSDSGAIRFEEGQVRFNATVADVDVPKTLRGIVASRIARLGPVPRYLLQVAAVAGERFSTDIVAAAAEEDPRSVADALGDADMQGIVTRISPQEHMFAHGLVRQVLVEGITLQARREIHAAIADAIAGLHPDRLDEMAERLARHHLEAGQPDEAVDFLVRAARRFERESALDEAIAALQRAVDVLANVASPDRDRMFRIYEEIAELCFRNRDLELGASIMDRALQAAESQHADRYVARFCVWRGRMLVSASRIEEGRRWLDQAQHVARGLTDRDLSRDVFIAKADADARSGEFEKAVGSLKEALELARAAVDSSAELRCLMPLALTYARMADHSSAMRTLEAVRRLGEEAGEPLLQAQILRLESQIHYHARDPESMARAAAAAMEIAREAGNFYEVALNAHNMGEAFLRMGDYRRAFAALRSSYEIASEHGYTRLQMSNMRVLGFIDATRFGSAEGRSRLLQAIDYAVDQAFVWDIIQGKHLLAIIDQARGDVEGARKLLREVLNLAVQHGHRKYTEDTEQALRQLEAQVPITVTR